MAKHSYKPTPDVTYYLVDAGVTVNTNDLLYFDGTYAQPASAMADQGSLLQNQAYFAQRFIGVAGGATTGNETADTEIPVIRKGRFQFDCDSTAFKNEEFVGAEEAASGTELEDQKVAQVADQANAIGNVVTNGTVTVVEFDIDPLYRELIR